MKKVRKVSKASFYLPDDLIVAMRRVKEEERINQSAQVELALVEYLRKKNFKI